MSMSKSKCIQKTPRQSYLCYIPSSVITLLSFHGEGSTLCTYQLLYLCRNSKITMHENKIVEKRLKRAKQSNKTHSYKVKLNWASVLSNVIFYMNEMNLWFPLFQPRCVLLQSEVSHNLLMYMQGIMNTSHQFVTIIIIYIQKRMKQWKKNIFSIIIICSIFCLPYS